MADDIKRSRQAACCLQLGAGAAGGGDAFVVVGSVDAFGILYRLYRSGIRPGGQGPMALKPREWISVSQQLCRMLVRTPYDKEASGLG
ncbi:hypothetical protein KBZ04_02750 [Cyanobium sp. N5-Cardenillas]|nr:hypothetical protein [Cyanobium sp. N5-Cardenillas]